MARCCRLGPADGRLRPGHLPQHRLRQLWLQPRLQQRWLLEFGSSRLRSRRHSQSLRPRRQWRWRSRPLPGSLSAALLVQVGFGTLTVVLHRHVRHDVLFAVKASPLDRNWIRIPCSGKAPGTRAPLEARMMDKAKWLVAAVLVASTAGCVETMN